MYKLILVLLDNFFTWTFTIKKKREDNVFWVNVTIIVYMKVEKKIIFISYKILFIHIC